MERDAGPVPLAENTQMKPNPNIAQDQCDGDEQQPADRIARAGVNQALMQLAVAGLDAEPAAIVVADPARRRRSKAPIRVDECLAAPSVLAEPTPRRAATDADLDRGGATLRIAERMRIPTAPLPQEKAARVGGRD